MFELKEINGLSDGQEMFLSFMSLLSKTMLSNVGSIGAASQSSNAQCGQLSQNNASFTFNCSSGTLEKFKVQLDPLESDCEPLPFGQCHESSKEDLIHCSYGFSSSNNGTNPEEFGNGTNPEEFGKICNHTLNNDVQSEIYEKFSKVYERKCFDKRLCNITMKDLYYEVNGTINENINGNYCSYETFEAVERLNIRAKCSELYKVNFGRFGSGNELLDRKTVFGQLIIIDCVAIFFALLILRKFRKDIERLIEKSQLVTSTIANYSVQLVRVPTNIIDSYCSSVNGRAISGKHNCDDSDQGRQSSSTKELKDMISNHLARLVNKQNKNILENMKQVQKQRLTNSMDSGEIKVDDIEFAFASATAMDSMRKRKKCIYKLEAADWKISRIEKLMKLYDTYDNSLTNKDKIYLQDKCKKKIKKATKRHNEILQKLIKIDKRVVSLLEQEKELGRPVRAFITFNETKGADLCQNIYKTGFISKLTQHLI